MRHALRSLSLTVPLALASCADPGDEPMSTATAGVSGCDVGDSGCGEHVWSFGFGDSQIQFAMGLALDRSDGVAVIGDFAGTVDFGGGSEGALTSVDSVDVFVATRAADGSPRWARRFGEQGRQWAGGIAVDDAGDILAVGLFEGRIEIDGVSLASTDEFDAFVIKLAGDDGHLLWATTFGGDRRQYASEVLVDDHGDIIVVGQSAGTTSFAEGQAHSSQDFDVFVARLAGESGALTDVSAFDGAGDQVVKRAALDASGDLVLCGHFTGDVDFGGGELHTPDYDLFVVQLAPSGAHRWSKQIGQEGAEELTCAVTADAEDHVILTGDLGATVDLGGGVLGGDGGPFVVKYDREGGHVWSLAVEGRADALAVATDADGKILITGDFDRTIAFPGGPTLVVAERYDGFHGEDVFVAALSPAGEHLWSRRFGDEDRQFGMAIAAKSDGDVVVTGNYGGSIDFQGSGILDAQWLPSTGSGYNVFLAALKG